MNTQPATMLRNQWDLNGFITARELVTASEAAEHREALERGETSYGALHYVPKIHTLMRSPLALATQPAALDIVEQLIGADILLYNATYIIKEPDSAAHVSWHQDLTYWGLSSDRQVTMWLALSPATEESGCMRMLPGSHTQGQLNHETNRDETNVLFQGQTVSDVDENQSVLCPLAPGDASFHHGWTLHASMPNYSTDRRIGLNVQYLAPEVRQLKHDADTAMLVRGIDRYGHFAKDLPATDDFAPDAVQRHAVLEQRYKEIAAQE